MPRAAHTLLPLSLLLLGCKPPPERELPIPHRADWEVVVNDAPFPHRDGAGVMTINTMTIGGVQQSDNWVNRGDVYVYYEPGRTTIKVEIRKFVNALESIGPEPELDKINFWASTGALALGPPAADEDCSTGWKDLCTMRIWYDGMIQPEHSGADIRVTLPADYIGGVEIRTTDNIAKETYHNLGNVCVVDFAGTNLKINTEEGDMIVRLADGLSPGPTCTAEQIESCYGTEPDAVCGCEAFATVALANDANKSSNITIDANPALWFTATMNNGGGMANGAYCPAVISMAEYPALTDLETATDTPWRDKQENHQAPAAPTGSGAQLGLTSDKCAPVANTENPEEYVGEVSADETPSQDLALHGVTRVCAGCLRTGADPCDWSAQDAYAESVAPVAPMGG